MKIKLYSALLTLSVAAVFKISAQSLHYEYVRNDPFDIKNFSLAVDPIFFDVNGHNSYAFGWGLRAEHMMGKALLANFDMRTGFGTNLYRKSNDNTRNYFNIEGGLGLIFVNRTKTKNVGIILSQSTSGNTRTTTYIKGGVPAKCRFIMALRGGFVQYTNTLNYDKLPDSLLTINDVTYKDAKAGYAFKDTVSAVRGDVPHVGGIALTSLYGGIQFRQIRNVLLDVDGYGYRGNIVYSDFYIDVLFAPVVGLKDFKNPDGTVYEIKYKEVSRLGWRFGWFVRKPKEQGFSFKFEVGSRPGFKAPTNTNVPVNVRNMYCMMTFGLYVPFKLKPMYTGE